jgi:hypothetical protein
MLTITTTQTSVVLEYDTSASIHQQYLIQFEPSKIVNTWMEWLKHHIPYWPVYMQPGNWRVVFLMPTPLVYSRKKKEKKCSLCHIERVVRPIIKSSSTTNFPYEYEGLLVSSFPIFHHQLFSSVQPWYRIQIILNLDIIYGKTWMTEIYILMSGWCHKRLQCWWCWYPASHQ